MLIGLGLLAALGGCSKKSEASMAPGYYGDADMGGAYPAEPMAGEADIAEEAAMVEAEYDDGMEFEKSARREARADMEPPPAPNREVAAPAPSGGTTTASKGKPEPAIAEPDDQPDDHGRQIIYTANMQVGVYNIQKAMEVAEAIPGQVGGWVHSRSEGHITMKIPAAKLREVMAELGALGNVLVRELQAQDVTAEYTDLESRIKVLRETQAQLIELLKKAKNVEEALHVRRALDDVTMQLEMALGRMRQLQNAISFSTLTVTFVEQGPHTDVPTSNDPFPWVDSLGVESTEWR